MMSMSSDRFRVQKLIELEIGCSDPESLKLYKSAFESLTVSPALQTQLIAASCGDAAGLYFKAILSISEAILALSRGYHSWAVVKLYYAVFYLSRCIFAARSLTLIKCSGIYTLQTVVGASPVKRDKGKFRGQDIRGDHKTVLATYISDIGASDKILSNRIDGDTVFEWMMKRREDVHYRAPTFREPDLYIFDANILSGDKLVFWINQYLSDDDFVYCFLEDHCCLATPLKFAQQAKSELAASFSGEPMLSDTQAGVIEAILHDTGVHALPGFRELIEM